MEDRSSWKDTFFFANNLCETDDLAKDSVCCFAASLKLPHYPFCLFQRGFVINYDTDQTRVYIITMLSYIKALYLLQCSSHALTIQQYWTSNQCLFKCLLRFQGLWPEKLDLFDLWWKCCVTCSEITRQLCTRAHLKTSITVTVVRTKLSFSRTATPMHSQDKHEQAHFRMCICVKSENKFWINCWVCITRVCICVKWN